MYIKRKYGDDIQELMEDDISFGLILVAKTPMQAKIFGRKVTPFNFELWNNNVCSIAKEIVFQKFKNVSGLADILLSTNSSLLVEGAPRDRYWGIGMGVNNPNIYYPPKWNGSNILGWALMEARDELKKAM